MKHALEKVSCVPEPTNERRVSDLTEEVEENSNVLADDNYDYYDKGDEYTDKEKTSKVSKAVKLTDIPLEELPCPKELMQSIEETYGHPVQNEIRLKGVSKVGRDLPSFLLIVTLLIVV